MQLLLGRKLSSDVDTMVAHQKVEFEDKLEDLIERDLQSVVTCSSQETFFKNRIEVRVVEVD